MRKCKRRYVRCQDPVQGLPVCEMSGSGARPAGKYWKKVRNEKKGR